MMGAQVSTGAQTLLRIAVRSNGQASVSASFTLLRALEALNHLHESAKTGSVPEELRRPQIPGNLLQLAATLSHHIYEEQSKGAPALESPDQPHLTRFDSHVHQALAQTLADTIWPEREPNDPPVGPSLNVCLQHLSAESERTVIEKFVRNYVGNILQHFFAATEVRRQVRDLPEDTEVRLRSVDGGLVARRLMTLLQSDKPTPAEVASTLGFVITEEVGG